MRLKETSSCINIGEITACSSCGQIDHDSARSREYQNYKLKLDEVLKNKLRKNYECFMNKLYLQSVIKPEK